MTSQSGVKGERFTFPTTVMGPRGLMGPLIFVVCPSLFSAMAMESHPLGAVLLLPAILYVANWLLLVPRYVEVHSDGLAIAYWLRRQRVPARTVAAARAASSEELRTCWGLLLPYRIWATLKMNLVGPVRIIATDFCPKYALVHVSTGLPLLIGCELSTGLVGAVRAMIAGQRQEG